MSDGKSKNNKRVLQKVGSFLGVTEDDSQMRVWKDKCTERAQSGEVGVSFKNIIPGADRGQKQLLSQLERTLSEVSAACQQNQLLLDEFAQSSIPNADMRSQAGRDTLLDSSMAASSASQEPSFQGSSKVFGTREKSPANIDEEQARPNHQNTRLQPPKAQNVGTKEKQSSEMIEMMPRLHTPNRFSQIEDIGVSSAAANAHSDKTGTHPTVSKILSNMVKENEKRRQAACYRLYYKKPPMLRESLLSAVERDGETEDVTSPTSEVAITNREYTQSEPCLQQKKDHSSLAVATLKGHSDWMGNPQVFDADMKATRRSSITFSPLVKKFTFPMEPLVEGYGRSENLLKKLFYTKQPRLKQLQKEGRVELEGDQQREVEEAVIQSDISHPLYAAPTSSLTHLEDRPSKSILKNRLLEAGEFDPNPELEDYLTSETKLRLVPTEGNDEYLYRAEALEHYRKFVAGEIAFKKEELLRKKLALEKMIIQKQKLIDDVLEMTDAHFYDPRGNSKKGWKQLMKENCRVLFLNESKDGRNRSIREQLYRLHEFMPVFTYFMCVTQFIITVILVTLGGVNPVGLEPQLILRSNVPTFRGLETVEHWKVRNIWVGPPPMFFVKMGGLFAPCLRDDIFVNMLYAMKGYGEDPTIGCCEMPNRHAAATTTETECDQMTSGVGIWWKGELCSERRKQNVSWTFNHILRPCCYSLKTQCKMMSHEHCTFLEGVFFFGDNPKTEHCSLVNCVSQLCSLSGRKQKTKMPYLTTGMGQWYRLITAVFAHQGIIHVLLVMLLQLLIGHQIEMIAGWLRIGIIYWVSAIMGLMVGATFNPYLPHLGAGAAVFGLIGVVSVELIQSWQLITHPWREVLKLVLICALFILSGTLPFVDNMELITGYMFGALTSIIVLPYITFGKWHAVRKRIIVAIAIPVLLLSVFAVFFLFLHAQWISTQCTACTKINCVPYTKTMCKISELW